MATMVDAFTRYAYTFPKLLDGAQESDGDLLMAARRYTENHFSAYKSLKQHARNMYSDMIGGLSTDFLIEVEDRYHQFDEYLNCMCKFFLYQGMEAALRQYRAIPGESLAPLALKTEFSRFLSAAHMTEQRRLAWLGILKAGELIGCPHRDRSYQLQRARERLACCYICVVVGYEHAVAHFIKFSDAYRLDFLYLADLRRDFLKLCALEELVSQKDLKLLILDI